MAKNGRSVSSLPAVFSPETKFLNGNTGGSKNTSIHVEDQGLVFAAEPHRTLKEALLSRAVQLGTIMDAIDEEIANIEIDLERHRKTVDRITAIKNKLAEKSTY